MFAWLKRNKADRYSASRWRDTIMAKARSPEPYVNGWVEDTFDGRFDMVSLVATLAMRRLNACGAKGQGLSRQVSEVLFSDFDHALREEGVGDSAIARKIRKMGEQFFGLARAVDMALQADTAQDELTFVLQRNVQPDEAKARLLAQLVLSLDQEFWAFNDAVALSGPDML